MDKVDFYIEVVLSSISLVVFVVLFIKTGRNLDKSAIFILLSFFFGGIIRTFSAKSDNSILDSMLPLAGNLTWAGLLHFVFEMSLMQSLIIEESHYKYKLHVSRFRIFKIAMFCNLIVIYCPLNILNFYYNPRVGPEYRKLMIVLALIRAFSFFIFISYLFPAFIYHFNFFVVKKMNSMKEIG